MKLDRKFLQELRDLEKHGYKLSDAKPNGLVVSGLIVISHGNKELHDSGYPFIKIWGIVDKELVFFRLARPSNTDSFGKNIFHIFPWMEKNKKWKVDDNFMSCSTFQIGDYENKDEEFIILE